MGESSHPTCSFSFCEVGLLCLFLGEPSVIKKGNKKFQDLGLVLVSFYYDIREIRLCDAM